MFIIKLLNSFALVLSCPYKVASPTFGPLAGGQEAGGRRQVLLSLRTALSSRDSLETPGCPEQMFGLGEITRS